MATFAARKLLVLLPLAAALLLLVSATAAYGAEAGNRRLLQDDDTAAVALTEADGPTWVGTLGPVDDTPDGEYGSDEDEDAGIELEAAKKPKAQPKVVLYSELNFKGNAASVGVGTHYFPIGKVADNSLSSLHVPAGLKVTIYSKKAKTGCGTQAYPGKWNLSGGCLRTASVIVVAKV